jgi:hypothetical protein
MLKNSANGPRGKEEEGTAVLIVLAQRALYGVPNEEHLLAVVRI